MDTLNPYEGRRAHWIRPNETERFPHRWIVADTEGLAEYQDDRQIQTLRCVDAVRWRDDLKTGLHEEWHAGESATDFWQWVDDYTRAGHRTVVWFHNEGYDLRTLDAFRLLPSFGWQLEWCNLSSDVSVVTFRSDHGTLVIADTYTWVNKPLADIGGMVGIGKPQLPENDGSLSAFHARCKADVLITQAAVLELLAFVKSQHLGNWQPTGSGMGYAAWRHRFLTHKVLVHDDAPAIAAEREAMHAGRAEAWWHGKASGGPFTEWDSHMSYPRIAAECDLPVKLFAYDGKPTAEVHKWAMRHWIVLCKVRVHTDRPVVPCHHGDRIIWPVGDFETTLWQPELELLTYSGGTYEVLEQWRYNGAPCLKEWAEWSIFTCGQPDNVVSPLQKAFVKHQARAVIGRLGLRHSTWEEWGSNPFNWCGLSDYVDADSGDTARLLHVGDKTFMEGERREADSSLPQITGYIMSEARVRLWTAAEIAGFDHVLHVDTDSIITDRYGNAAMEQFAALQLRGAWRQKERWHQLTVVGPRHYRASGRRVIPGVPRTAEETSPGRFDGEVWQSVGAALTGGQASAVVIMSRTWRPKIFDGRRPWSVEGPAEPIRLPVADEREAVNEPNRSRPVADDNGECGLGYPHIQRGGQVATSPRRSGKGISPRRLGREKQQAGGDRQRTRHEPRNNQPNPNRPDANATSVRKRRREVSQHDDRSDPRERAS